jgi:putative endonuclease
LVFSVEIGDKSAASRAEYRLKKLSKKSKELFIRGKTSLSNLGIVENSTMAKN